MKTAKLSRYLTANYFPLYKYHVFLAVNNGLETKISRKFLGFLHSGHEFCVISGHGT